MKQSTNDHPFISNGVPPFSEPILCTYIDLDRLIETAGLTEIQQKVVAWLMCGYSELDIAEEMECTKQAVNVHFRKAVDKIVKRDIRIWEATYKKEGGKGEMS